MNICISVDPLRRSARLSKWGDKWVAPVCFAVGLLMVASPSVVEGQASGPERENWTLGIAAGVFKYEPSADEGFPIFVARADRPISKWVRFVAATSYTRPEIQTNAQNMFDPTLPAEHTNLFTVTLGFQLKWAAGRLEPYVGISGGYFGRYDGDSMGRRFGRSTFQFPLGIRLWATNNIGVRAEYRFDEDSHEVVTHSDSEMTAGVFWTF